MPLNKGKSLAAFRSNVGEMLKAGYPRDQALAAAYRIRRGKKRGGRVGYDDGGPVNFEDRWAGASDPFTARFADATDDFGARWGDMPSNTVRREEANPGRAMRQMLATQGFNQRLGDVAGEKAAGMANLYQTFGDTLQGKYTPQPADPRVWTEEDQEARNRGADQLARRAPFLALDTMWAASPFAKEPNSVGVFGGRLAKTADQAKLAQAEEMAAKGIDRDEIWKTTGWGQAADGRWKFEIPDNLARFKREPTTPHERNVKGELQVGDFFEHPELYHAYPEMEAAPFTVDVAAPAIGSFDRKTGTVGVLRHPPPPETRKSVALHELQHATQQKEGFASGINLDQAADAFYGPINERLSELAKSLAGTSIGDPYRPVLRAAYDALMDQKLSVSPRDLYKRHAGEVEARNVQTRKDMTPEERLASPPWTTEDIPRDQQIVRFNADGPQASVGTLPQPTWYHGTNKNFDKFDLNAVRATGEPDIAVHLSSSRPLAGGYAGNNGRVIEANTGFKNPKIIEKETWGGRSSNAQEIERAKVEGHDGIIYRYTGDHSHIDPANPHPQEAVAWAPGTILDPKTASDLLMQPKSTRDFAGGGSVEDGQMPVSFEDRWIGASNPFAVRPADAPDTFASRWDDMPSNLARREESNPARAMRQMLATQGFNDRAKEIGKERLAGLVDMHGGPGGLLNSAPQQPEVPGQWSEMDQFRANAQTDAAREQAAALGVGMVFDPFGRMPNKSTLASGLRRQSRDDVHYFGWNPLDDAEAYQMNALKRRNDGIGGTVTMHPSYAALDRSRGGAPATGSWDRHLAETKMRWDADKSGIHEDYLDAAYPDRLPGFWLRTGMGGGDGAGSVARALGGKFTTPGAREGSGFAELQNAAVKASQPLTKAQLPPPKPFMDRIWDNYAKRMSPDEFLQSEPLWSGAQRMAEATPGMSEATAFAHIANDIFKRMGTDRYLTPQAANQIIGEQRGSGMLSDILKQYGQPRENRGFAGGGGVPWYVRSSARGLEHAGFIHSPVAGRSDKLPLSVKSQSYVLPADIVSALGDGNSLAGANGLNKMFRLGPYGSQSSPLKMGSAKPIRQRFASGGPVGVPTDIVAAGGEYSIPPETIAEIGGGDVQRGQDLLDTMVRQVRRKAIHTLKHLPGPKSK